MCQLPEVSPLTCCFWAILPASWRSMTAADKRLIDTAQALCLQKPTTISMYPSVLQVRLKARASDVALLCPADALYRQDAP